MASNAKISPSPSWTGEQLAAIEYRGTDLLVSAAAGAGKTAVLVQRAIDRIIKDGVDVEQLLVVTFTDAAASEMKARLAGALRKALAAATHGSPLAERLAMQAALLDRASISTIHSFCLGVARRNFHRLGLDPSFKVMDENEAELLLQDVVDQLFEEFYGSAEVDQAFLDLVDVFGSDRGDDGLQTLATGLYKYLRSQDDPDGWLDRTVSLARGAGAGRRFEDSPWFPHARDAVILNLEQAAAFLRQARREARRPDGPGHYLEVLEEDIARVEAAARAGAQASTWAALGDKVEDAGEFGRLRGRAAKGATLSDDLVETVKKLRDHAKRRVAQTFSQFFAGAFETGGGAGDAGDAGGTGGGAGDAGDASGSGGGKDEPAGRRTGDSLMREIASMAPHLEKLAGIVRTLGRRFAEAKAARGQVDFADLEHLALKALGGPGGELSEAALELRARYAEVLVDEYQDVNGVQNAILERVARRDPGNLFLVGDVKQSIYRFRLADPGLFLEKYRRFRRLDPTEAALRAGSPPAPGKFAAQGTENAGRLLALKANFRSRRQVVDAVNFVFRQIMTASVGELKYDEEAALVYGATCYGRDAGGVSTDAPPVEFHLVERQNPEPVSEAGTGASAEAGGREGATPNGTPGDGEPRVVEEENPEMLAALEKEARVVAQRIKEMVEGGPAGGPQFQVYDRALGGFRGVRYRDIAILMSAPRARANTVIDVMARAGIPSYAELGTGYFQATEIEAMLALLRVIDNPRQDIYLAAVLRSPLVGLSAAELAYIRAAAPQTANYLDAVMKAPGVADLSPAAVARLGVFMERLERWRTAARRAPLSELIWRIYRETGFMAYAGGMPGGQQRQANLRALYDRAREFDNFARQGLSRFLRFVRRLQENEGDLGTARALGEAEDVVRVMSIHKSKGLEYPVVFLMDLGKQFNLRDLSGDLLWHKELGFGPKFVDTALRLKFPTVAHRAIAHRLRLEALAEELRVLYVAMTRARERLVLVGSAKDLRGQIRTWCERADGRDPPLADHALASAATFLDWLCPALARHGALGHFAQVAGHEWADPPPAAVAEDVSAWDVVFWGMRGVPGAREVPGLDEEARAAAQDWPWDALAGLEAEPGDLKGAPAVSEALLEELGRRLAWEYRYLPLSGRAAKVRSVEAKRRLEAVAAVAEFGAGGEAGLAREAGAGAGAGAGAEAEGRWGEPAAIAREGGGGAGDAAARGSATHALLRHLDLAGPLDEGGIKSQLDEIVKAGRLTAEEAALALVPPVAGFFATELGRRLARAAAGTAAVGAVAGVNQGRARVWRELPFTAGLPVTLLHEFPPEFDISLAKGELVIVQGIMDCLFEDEDGLVLLDFKTDRVPAGAAAAAIARDGYTSDGGASGDDTRDGAPHPLVDRYAGQMRLYSLALEAALGRAPDEVYLVLLQTGEAVRVPERFSH